MGDGRGYHPTLARSMSGRLDTLAFDVGRFTYYGLPHTHQYQLCATDFILAGYDSLTGWWMYSTNDVLQKGAEGSRAGQEKKELGRDSARYAIFPRHRCWCCLECCVWYAFLRCCCCCCRTLFLVLLSSLMMLVLLPPSHVLLL